MPDGDERDSIYERLFILMTDADLAMQKSKNTFVMNQEELDNYQKLTRDLDEKINQSKNEIQKVKDQLVQAKASRKNRMEYENTVIKIEIYPSREQSIEKLHKIKTELKELEEKKIEIMKKLEQRKKQFEQLVKTAQEINQSLGDDDREDISLEDEPMEPEAEGPKTPIDATMNNREATPEKKYQTEDEDEEDVVMITEDNSAAGNTDGAGDWCSSRHLLIKLYFIHFCIMTASSS